MRASGPQAAGRGAVSTGGGPGKGLAGRRGGGVRGTRTRPSVVRGRAGRSGIGIGREGMSLSERAEWETRRWLEKVVIGLNLCPFAEPAARGGGVRVVACVEEDVEGVVRCVAEEAEALAAQISGLGTSEVRTEGAASAEVDLATATTTTTLVVCPSCRDLDGFEAYLECAEAVEATLWDELGLEGVLQVATFHPEYRFAGEEPGDAASFTNRSPWPTFHLLREVDVGRAVDTYPGGTEAIPARNVARLRGMGADEVDRLHRSLRHPVPPERDAPETVT